MEKTLSIKRKHLVAMSLVVLISYGLIFAFATQDSVLKLAAPNPGNLPVPGHLSTEVVVNVDDAGTDPAACSGDLTLQQSIDRGCIGDNLGDHTATQDIDMSGNTIRNLTDPTAGGDAVNLQFLEAQLAGAASGGCFTNWNEASCPVGYTMVLSGNWTIFGYTNVGGSVICTSVTTGATSFAEVYSSSNECAVCCK